MDKKIRYKPANVENFYKYLYTPAEREILEKKQIFTDKQKFYTDLAFRVANLPGMLFDVDFFPLQRFFFNNTTTVFISLYTPDEIKILNDLKKSNKDFFTDVYKPALAKIIEDYNIFKKTENLEKEY